MCAVEIEFLNPGMQGSRFCVPPIGARFYIIEGGYWRG
jgi:hypothetical protein